MTISPNQWLYFLFLSLLHLMGAIICVHVVTLRTIQAFSEVKLCVCWAVFIVFKGTVTQIANAHELAGAGGHWRMWWIKVLVWFVNCLRGQPYFTAQTSPKLNPSWSQNANFLCHRKRMFDSLLHIHRIEVNGRQIFANVNFAYVWLCLDCN